MFSIRLLMNDNIFIILLLKRKSYDLTKFSFVNPVISTRETWKDNFS